MKIAVPKEIVEFESRIAISPETAGKLASQGCTVSVQTDAGLNAGFTDEAFRDAGATIESDQSALLGDADIVFKVQNPVETANGHEVDLLREGSLLIAFLRPLWNFDLVQRLADRKITAFSMDSVPRIARAQKLDALSSQSNVAGYKAVLMAANHLGKMMPLMMTAAGTVSPSRVFIIGAGVAGLQAIATAKRLGAVVTAFDTRPVVKDQVESLGGRFAQFELEKRDTEDKGGYAKELSDKEHELELAFIADHVADADIVITTAQIPGKPSPLLITEDAVKRMRYGSVIVDLAVEGGGNCALTERGKTVRAHGVQIIGEPNIPSLMAGQSSDLYSRNVSNLFAEFFKDGRIELDLEDEIIKGALITHEGKIAHPDVLKAMGRPISHQAEAV